ncbi:MAG: RsmD family RNA methyltransferase [Chitinophagales bacterium]|nr:RsmD family RNA methyltransferase [Chitinophagales bacterium]
MRIIGGSLKGRRFNPPKGLPVRPTTDFSKESIFNILNNRFDFESLIALDLFAGTGNISFELASRGCENITAVDNNSGCARYMQNAAKELGIEAQIDVVKEDVFSFLRNPHAQYDLIFADPPYTFENLDELISLVFENNLLKAGGWFILEHQPKVFFEKHPRFVQQRKYGSSLFSIFQLSSLS